MDLAEAEEGRPFLWTPVLLGVGIAAYFALPVEPSVSLTAGVAAASLLCGLVLHRFIRMPLLATALVLVAGGFVAAKLRTEQVKAPVIPPRGGVYLVEGRVLSASVSARGSQHQLLLGDLRVETLKAIETPIRVRINSRLRQELPSIGTRIRLRAVLRPPPGPVRPGGFDFARKAWFAGIGGVGFALSKAEFVKSAAGSGWREWIETQRNDIAARIRALDKGNAGEIAVALIIGDREGLDDQTMKSIRIAGLAHMLAISGMHMALVAGGLYWLIRALLALSEPLALRYDIRKGAALAAMLAALLYYLISGMGLATLRALIMILIVFTAVFLGRPALNLRNVAVAALVMLMVMPESLLDVSFQMSFAAVTALIAVYERFPRQHRRGIRYSLPLRLLGRGVRGFFMIAVTTSVAGLAVLPIAVYHFHQISTYSLVGNLLAMPVLTLWVMPMGLLGMVLLPFGLQTVPFGLMAEGSNAILNIAERVSALPGARVGMGLIGTIPMLLMLGGALWIALWQSRLRFLGLIPLISSLALAPFSEKPVLLIARDASTVALVDDSGRLWPARENSGGYTVDEWRRAFGQQEDGEPAAHEGPPPSPWLCDPEGCTVLFRALRVAYSFQPGALEEDCSKARILISTYPVGGRRSTCANVDALIDLADTKRRGAHAVYIGADRIRIVSNADARGERPWSQGSDSHASVALVTPR